MLGQAARGARHTIRRNGATLQDTDAMTPRPTTTLSVVPRCAARYFSMR